MGGIIGAAAGTVVSCFACVLLTCDDGSRAWLVIGWLAETGSDLGGSEAAKGCCGCVGIAGTDAGMLGKPVSSCGFSTGGVGKGGIAGNCESSGGG